VFDAGLTSAGMYILFEDITIGATAATTSAIQTFTTATTGFLKVGDQLLLLDDGPPVTDQYIIDPIPVTTVDVIRIKVANASAGAPGARASAQMKFLVIKAAAQNTSTL
jgi:hypothetical protein